MSTELSIHDQIVAYQQLLLQHQTARREHQSALIEGVEYLHNEIQHTLVEDKNAFETAEENYHHEFNVLKRIFNSSASDYHSKFVLPYKELYHQRKDLNKKVSELLNDVKQQSQAIESRTHWNGSICVVYNPITGQIEWRKYWHGGVHGIFNPRTGLIEWKERYHSGVYGVFNPRLNEIEWKTQHNGGVHGVYNPSLGIVEWKTASRRGVGGVYNPSTGKIEWKTEFDGGVVGYYDHQSQTVQWIKKWHHGIALIVWDPVIQTYLTTSSCGWYDNED